MVTSLKNLYMSFIGEIAMGVFVNRKILSCALISRRKNQHLCNMAYCPLYLAFCGVLFRTNC